MKKIIPLILVAAAAMLAYTSCKKQDLDQQTDVDFYSINLSITSSGDTSLPDAIRKIFDNYTEKVNSIVNLGNTALKDECDEATAKDMFEDVTKLINNARNRSLTDLKKFTDKVKRTVTPTLSLYCLSDTSNIIDQSEYPLSYDNK